MFSDPIVAMIIRGIGETLLMTLASTFFGYVIGLPWGVGLTITKKGGLAENPLAYRILDVLSNLMRSIPFLILLILLIPVTRFIVGTSVGTKATILPLTVSAAPMIARMVQSSLEEVDSGVIEAARAMGASTSQIVFHVLLVEGRISLISGATISTTTVLGYSAMAGIVGGGGLGDIAIRYGYYRYEAGIMVITVILLVVLVQVFQLIGNRLVNKLDRRR
ncbi:MAG: methionine ABC transporter permease [Lachnospiraceae bacterium]|nr:methionine ABC transporter permease [Lachnospiraceae bacterium]